ncbi:hypothetical protein HYALB_00008506 [Hymenoscyphus albidus]|uniref:Arabinanase/levansucrase/invertase n=1 Tax=Hymenoscyphus albidus TaxID=595503 RepID=A0A9N9LUI0_9HELO|nr:hypothetical protein HYALB_00008506 [Hymenoscyphus albidus]
MKFTQGIALAILAYTANAATWIVPGAIWTDTSGARIDAHGGNIVQRGDTFFWVGQSASNNEQAFMYSSTDLLNWTPLGKQNDVQYLWRPKIAKPNGSFWLYGQLDRHIQSMVSTTMVGNYKLHGAAVSVPPNDLTYSDTGMFRDTDLAWYIITSADHNTVSINILNSDGSVGDRASKLAAGAYEAPGILKVDGTYYLIVSGKTGWRSNPNKVFTSSSINGPWEGGSNIAPEAEKTYNSQNTFELTIAGSKTTTYIYMGDSWDSKGGPDSTHMWLPIKVNSGAKTLTLDYHAMWKVDVKTGVVSFPAAGKRYAALDAERSGNSVARKRSVHRVDSSSGLVFRNITGTGKKQWVSFHYTVNSQEAGDAFIMVNEETRPTNISALNLRAGFHNTVPVEIHLERGSENIIKFGVEGSGFEATVDGIEVFEDEEEL